MSKHDISKYILFNQISALIEDDFVENESFIDNLLHKYDKLFFRIPESIRIYFKYTELCDYVLPEDFFDNVLTYLKLNKQYSEEQIEILGMEIYKQVVTEHNHFDNDDDTVKQFNRLRNIKGDMLCLLRYNFNNRIVSGKYIKNNAFKQIVEHGYFHKFSSLIALDITNILKSLSLSIDFHFHDLDSFKDALITYIQQLAQPIKLTRKSKGILDIYGLLINEIVEAENIVFDKEDINSFISSYLSQLQFFKIDNNDSEYYNYYVKLLSIQEKNNIIPIIKSNKITAIREKQLEYINSNKSRVFYSVAFQYIFDEEDVYWEIPFFLYKTLVSLPDYKIKLKEASKELEKTINNDYLYKIEQFISYITKLKISCFYPLIYDIFMSLSGYIFNNFSTNAAKSYNSIGDFLNFLIKYAKAEKESQFDKDLINKCLNKIEEVYFNKQTKKHKTIYQKAVKALLGEEKPGNYLLVTKYFELFANPYSQDFKNECIKYIKDENTEAIIELFSCYFNFRKFYEIPLLITFHIIYAEYYNNDFRKISHLAKIIIQQLFTEPVDIEYYIAVARRLVIKNNFDSSVHAFAIMSQVVRHDANAFNIVTIKIYFELLFLIADKTGNKYIDRKDIKLMIKQLENLFGRKIRIKWVNDIIKKLNKKFPGFNGLEQNILF